MNGRELPLLEDIIAGKIAGRIRGEQITMLRNGSGIGIQFAAVAAKAYEHAKQLAMDGKSPPIGSLKQSIPSPDYSCSEEKTRHSVDQGMSLEERRHETNSFNDVYEAWLCA